MTGIRQPKVKSAPEVFDSDADEDLSASLVTAVPAGTTTATAPQAAVADDSEDLADRNAFVAATPQQQAVKERNIKDQAVTQQQQVREGTSPSIRTKPGTFYSVDALLKFLKENQGSDIHVSSGNWVMIRVRGTMYPLNYRVGDKEVRDLILPFLSKVHVQELEKERSVDFSFVNPGTGVFRANVFYQRHGLAFVLRLLPEKAPALDELNVPSIVRRSCYTDNGLILVTGPTGSGKSTTLAAMINEINMNKRGHIITIEDPIEFLHESKKCMVTQRGLGAHFTSFSHALRAALREDPDVILVGEMRDRETMEAAIRAAETGHLVLSTLHTGSAAKSVDRILNSFPADEQGEIRTVLSETLRVVISQKLIPNKTGTKLKLFQDIMVNTRAIGNLIREGKTYLIENAMQTSSNEGMVLMDKSIREAAEEGAIRMADAHEMANDKRIIEESAAFARNELGVMETVQKLSKEEFGKLQPGGIATSPVDAQSLPDMVKEVLPPDAIPREIIGLKNIVAELKPGYKKPAEKAKAVENKTSPVHIVKKKPE